MKVLLIVGSVFLTLTTCGQFTHKADSLIRGYLRTLKKKKPEWHLIIQKGRFDHSKKEARTSLTKVDSLKILSIAEIDNYFEIAVFDDSNPPQFFNVDTCTIFQLIKDKKNDFLQRREYTKS